MVKCLIYFKNDDYPVETILFWLFLLNINVHYKFKYTNVSMFNFITIVLNDKYLERTDNK